MNEILTIEYLLQPHNSELSVVLFSLGDVTNRLAQLLAFTTATVTLLLLWPAHIAIYTKIAQAQAFVLAELFLLIALTQQEITPFMTALWVTVIRGIIIPWVFIRSIEQQQLSAYNQTRLHPSIVGLIAGILIIIGYRALLPLTDILSTKLAISSPLAFAGILLGILQIALTRSASAQIPGLLVIVNNCLLFTLLVIPAMSWVIAANLCFDLVIVAIVHTMGVQYDHDTHTEPTLTSLSEI